MRSKDKERINNIKITMAYHECQFCKAYAIPTDFQLC